MQMHVITSLSNSTTYKFNAQKFATILNYQLHQMTIRSDTGSGVLNQGNMHPRGGGGTDRRGGGKRNF